MLAGRRIYSLLLILLTAVFHLPLLTNQFTPGGDGNRVFPNLQIYDYYDSIFPLWDHFMIGGGAPFLAEPERFLWLSAIINTQSPYYNIQFNLLLLGLFTGAMLILYHIFLKLRFNPFAAFAGVFIIVFSDCFSECIYYGRINPLVNFVFSFAVILLYLQYKDTDEKKYIIAMGVLTGVCIDFVFYYTLITLYIPLLLISGYYLLGIKKQSVLRFFKFYIIDMLCISMIGVLIFSYSIFPMIDYMLFSGSITESEITKFAKLPEIKNIIHMFSTKYMYRDYSYFARIPLIFFVISAPYFVFRLKDNFQKCALFFFLVLFAIFFMLLLGREYPFQYLIEIWESIPVVGRIRSSSTIYFILSIAVAFIVMVTITHINISYKKFVNMGFVLILLYMVFYTITGIYTYDKKAFNGRDKPTDIYDCYSRISNDKDWFSVYNPDWLYTGGFAPLRKINNFSTYTPPEYKAALKVLFHDDSLNKLKAHWISRSNIRQSDINYRMLSLLNVKYLFLKRKHIHKDVVATWDNLVVGKKIDLYRNPEWETQLKFYTDYKHAGNKSIGETLKLYLTKRNFNKTALIDHEISPEIIGIQNTVTETNYNLVNNGYDLKVLSDQGGVLQIPSFYEKRWNVYIGGQKQGLLRVNGIYMGVYLDPGTHKIKFRYEPFSFYIGFYLSLFTIIIIILVSFYRIKVHTGQSKYSDL